MTTDQAEKPAEAATAAPAAEKPKADKPKAARKSEPKKCLDGCGGMTKGGHFITGHDAKLKSVLQKAHVAGDKTVKLGDTPYDGKSPMAIAKDRGWVGHLEKAAQTAKDRANRPARSRGAAATKGTGKPPVEGDSVQFAYRGSNRTGKVIEVKGERARVEFQIDDKTDTRTFGLESLTVVA
jgi:hypothetical protein